MNSVSTSLRRALLPLAFFGVLAGAPLASAASDGPTVNVTTPSEGEALAKGYEKMFERIKSGPIFLTYEREGSALRTLSGVRSVQAEGAVLLVVTDRGTSLVIPASRVLVITDERPPAQ